MRSYMIPIEARLTRTEEVRTHSDAMRAVLALEVDETLMTVVGLDAVRKVVSPARHEFVVTITTRVTAVSLPHAAKIATSAFTASGLFRLDWPNFGSDKADRWAPPVLPEGSLGQRQRDALAEVGESDEELLDN